MRNRVAILSLLVGAALCAACTDANAPYAGGPPLTATPLSAPFFGSSETGVWTRDLGSSNSGAPNDPHAFLFPDQPLGGNGAGDDAANSPGRASGSATATAGGASGNRSASSSGSVLNMRHRRH
jgi:hypothetical protein